MELNGTSERVAVDNLATQGECDKLIHLAGVCASELSEIGCCANVLDDYLRNQLHSVHTVFTLWNNVKNNIIVSRPISNLL